LDLAQTLIQRPVVVLLLPIVLVAMYSVARDFVLVYCHNALLIVVLVLIVTTRDMAGVGYLVVGMFVTLLWCVSVVKIQDSKQSKNEEKGFVEATAFMYLKHLTDIRPLNAPKMMIHETISIIS
jgi:hypothetical protein